MKNTKVDYVSVWLIMIVSMIITMVCLGGITRITGSGLSITEWNPIMGAIPPLNQAEWEVAFSKYKMIPQFQVLNSSMNLTDFKFIFFWEYFHRLVGRLTGLVVLIPGIYFIVKNKLKPEFTKKVIIGFSLGLAQGFMGWFMVSSGLSELVYVSHIRLMAHLMLALFILSYWSTLYLSWRDQSSTPMMNDNPSSKALKSVYVVAVILGVQLCYGAFVAGLKGGYSFNTFPTMNGEWIPSLLFSTSPWWLNFFSDVATTQFIHRWLAVLFVGSVIAAIYFSKKESKSTAMVNKGYHFLIIAAIQFITGVITLMYHVPVAMGTLHQFNACMLVVSITAWIYHLKRANS